MTGISKATQEAVRASLHPELAQRMDRVLKACGGRLVMLSGHRAPAEQARLYEKGRRVVWSADWRPISELIIDRAKIVTNARPMSSAHNYGPSRAVDCVLDPALVVVRERKGRPDLWETGTPEARAAWDAYGEAVRAEGLVWGGSWKMRDLPHAELLDFRSKQWDV
jgi:hypothetical protein